jgi:hypothetical protein
MVRLKKFFEKFFFKDRYYICKKNLEELIEIEINDILINHYQDKKFRSEIKILLQGLIGTSIYEGLKIIESLIQTKNIEGDVCEFGVAQGKTSKLIAYVIKKLKTKKLFLYDSFQGLPKPTRKDELIDDIFNLGSIYEYEGKMNHSEYKVNKELSKIGFSKNRVVLNKGFFNQKTIKNFKFPKIVAFAYLDFDFYEPILDVLKTIEKKLIKNSIIIVDDYDFFSSGVKKAVDEWLKPRKKKFNFKIFKSSQSSFIKITKK